MADINVLGKDWTNIVFEARNKSYGAYKLRQENSKNTFLALILGLGVIGAIIGISNFYTNYTQDSITDRVVDNDPAIMTDVVFLPKIDLKKAPVEVLNNQTISGESKKSVQNQEELTEVLVKKDAQVYRELTTTQDAFTDQITSGSKNLKGSTEGEIKTNGTPTGTGNQNIGTNITTGAISDNGTVNKVHLFVQVKAQPIEGKEAFYKRYIDKFQATNIGSEINQIQLTLKFVVERDGSFTNIQVINDKNGIGKEAIRVLQSMPKWKPAEQNGKPVRSSFTLPIIIKVAN